MSSTFSMVLLIVVVLAVATQGLPLNPSSPLLRKISKRDTTDMEKKNSTSTITSEEKANSAVDNGDELIETEQQAAPDSQSSLILDEQSPAAASSSSDSGSSAERSIDWQLLSGNPDDLERELETRRRRRSPVHSSLSRQHRIRTAAGQHQQQRLQRRSRSKRNTYYVEDEDESVNPSDLLAAYAYLQARGGGDRDVPIDDEEQQQQQQPQISLLDDVNDSDLSNLASLVYELRNGDGDGEGQGVEPIVEEPIDDGFQDDQDIIPDGYADLAATNIDGDDEYEQPEIRITPEQLAALEQVLNGQDGDDDDNIDDGQDDIQFYPKDKRSVEPLLIDDGEEADEDGDDDVIPTADQDDEEPTYLIPTGLDPSSEYVQIPLSSAYQNPYEFYQTDTDPSLLQAAADEEETRRFDEEQLRERIASLIDDINEQRQIARRRRR